MLSWKNGTRGSRAVRVFGTDMSHRHQLRTFGHATLVVLENGVPIIATDPWLIGSCYWRSWWLERNPTPAEIDLVRDARFIYVTHSHPDHLHLPSIRHLRAAKTFLSPNFPGYPVPGYLEREGHSAITLQPFRWYRLSAEVLVAFAQVPIDDSILVIDTPGAVVVNINDSYPSKRLFKAIGRQLLSPHADDVDAA